MSSAVADDIQEYFNGNTSNCISDSEKTRFTDFTVTVHDIKEEPLKYFEATNNLNKRIDQTEKLHEYVSDRTFKVLDVGDHVISCKEESKDNFIFDYERKYQTDKLNEYVSDVKFEFLDVGDHIISCKDELQDTVIGDCIVETKLEKQLHTPNYNLNYDTCDGLCNGFCCKCQKVTYILDSYVKGETEDGGRIILPNNVLEIKVIGGTKGIFAVKTIPVNVKFGPCEGIENVLTVDGCAWILKGGKFVKAKTRKEPKWMSLVNSASNSSNQNLKISQYNNRLYYQSKRQIEKGEELLIYFSDCNINTELESYYYPPVEMHSESVYACTLCSLGFSTQERLLRHRRKCPQTAISNSSHEGIVQCLFCKIYLPEKEYSEFHMSFCSKTYSRNYIQSTSDHLQRKAKVQCACDRCDYECGVESDLRRHAAEEHSGGDGNADHQDGINAVRGRKEESFACQTCTFIGADEAALERHGSDLHRSRVSKKNELSLITITNQIECKMCHKTFTRKHTLKRHIRIHTGEKPFACDRCDYKCRQKGCLVRHLKGHDGVKPFECKVCNKAFTAKNHLKRHLLSHAGEKLFACDYCSYKGNYKASLKIHLRIHTGEKPYACHRCDFKCNDRRSLVRHLNSHDGVKPFKCKICNRFFGQNENLKKHLLTHTGEKLFTCHECEYGCNDKSSLIGHINSKHRAIGSKDHKCPKCNFETNSKKYLKEHLNIHDGVKPFHCQICKKLFTAKRSLTRHLFVHTGEKPFACHRCDYKCNKKGSLVRHLKKHDDVKPFECKILE